MSLDHGQRFLQLSQRSIFVEKTPRAELMIPVSRQIPHAKQEPKLNLEPQAAWWSAFQAGRDVRSKKNMQKKMHFF